MTAQKTTENNNSVEAFLNAITDEQKRKDCFALVQLISAISGYEAKMWGTGIVGFGSYHYRYESGREGDSSIVGFSPRKQNIALYLAGGFRADEDLLQKLGKYKTGGGCLYINSILTIDITVLEQIIRNSVKISLAKVNLQKSK